MRFRHQQIGDRAIRAFARRNGYAFNDFVLLRVRSAHIGSHFYDVLFRAREGTKAAEQGINEATVYLDRKPHGGTRRVRKTAAAKRRQP